MLKQLKKQFLQPQFIKFLLVGGVNTISGMLFAYVYAAVLQANLAFIFGYITSLTTAYFLNTFFVFKEKLHVLRYVKFCISYIPNFIIQNGTVFLVFNLLGWPKLLAFAFAVAIGTPISYLCVKLFAFRKDTDQ